jgi:hypothetical protein
MLIQIYGDNGQTDVLNSPVVGAYSLHALSTTGAHPPARRPTDASASLDPHMQWSRSRPVKLVLDMDVNEL